MSLSQLHKKHLEEFRELYKDDENEIMYCLDEVEGLGERLTLSTLQGVWQMLEEEINASRMWFRESEMGVTFCVACMEDDYCVHEIKIEALKDTQKKIEKEIIKIKENV